MTQAGRDGFTVENVALSLLEECFEKLRCHPGWTNARDATTAYEHKILPKRSPCQPPGDQVTDEHFYVSEGAKNEADERKTMIKQNTHTCICFAAYCLYILSPNHRTAVLSNLH